uniref:Leukocyte cell-derived chemotaxin-2 n=1 Tax=Denticeps clupeoides TaxID=299321 RepID=A0AAY4ESH4_9TELE
MQDYYRYSTVGEKMKCAVIITLLAFAELSVYGQKFGPLCGGVNRIRGCDSQGCGNFGAKRGSRTHKGVDIICDIGTTVTAPFDVELKGQALPYSSGKQAINNGIRLEGQGLCFKLFYIKPDKFRGTVKKGQKIGTMLDIKSVYPGITPHVHVQMCDQSDPTKYI